MLFISINQDMECYNIPILSKGFNMTLHSNQQLAIDLALTCNTLFITGEGGSGKSHIIEQIKLKCLSQKVPVVLLAPTHSACENIGGVTLHSALNMIPILDYENKIESEALHFGQRPDSDVLISENHCVIIDEVSMIGERFMNKILDKLSHVKYLIVVGDPLQAPPIKDAEFDFFDWADEFVLLTKNYRSSSLETSALLLKYRETKDTSLFDEITVDFENYEANPDDTIVAYKNETLYRLFKSIHNETQIDMIFRSYGKSSNKTTDGDNYFNTGCNVKMNYKLKSLENGLDVWIVQRADGKVTKSPSKMIVGGYKAYCDLLQDKYSEFRTIALTLEAKYGDGFKKECLSHEKEEFNFVYRAYIHIKNIPYGMHSNFTTVHKAQGKGYENVVVVLDEIPSTRLKYVAVSRVKNKLTILKI